MTSEHGGRVTELNAHLQAANRSSDGRHRVGALAALNNIERDVAALTKEIVQLLPDLDDPDLAAQLGRILNELAGRAEQFANAIEQGSDVRSSAAGTAPSSER